MSEKLERIELYVSGDLSNEDLSQFEEQMRVDPQLKESVDRYRLINEALNISVEDDLRKHLKTLESSQSSGNKSILSTRVRQLNFRWAVAASVFVLLCAGLWFLVGQGPSEVARFSEKQYLSYDYEQMRGEYHHSDFKFDMSGGHYDRVKAEQWFSNWLQSHPEDDEARFILSDVLKNSKHISEAKQELAIIMSHHSVLWGEKAEWNYVLLSVIGTKDDLAASTLQKMINDPSHSYHRQAMELSRILK